jgi:hypothetical protein
MQESILYSDYGTTIYANKIVFASARHRKLRPQKTYLDRSTFYKIVCVRCRRRNEFRSPAKFDKSINSKFNESTPVFTKDGKTIYFTRNNYLEEKGKDGNDNTLVKYIKPV